MERSGESCLSWDSGELSSGVVPEVLVSLVGDSMVASATMNSGRTSLALSESTYQGAYTYARVLTTDTFLSALLEIKDTQSDLPLDSRGQITEDALVGGPLALDSVKLHTGGSTFSSPQSQVPTSYGSVELAPEILSDEECWECDSGVEAETILEMMDAIDSGAALLVQHLVRSGADPYATMPEGGFTYLMVAAEGGHLDIARYFVETCHLEVDARDALGSTALEMAAEGGQLEVVRYLLSQGADVRNKAIDGSTPLHGARRGGHEEIARCLAEEWKSTAGKQDEAGLQCSPRASSEVF